MGSDLPSAFVDALRSQLGPQDVIEFRSEFLHAFMNTERVRSHKPVD